jgi:hypothetical protein
MDLADSAPYVPLSDAHRADGETTLIKYAIPAIAQALIAAALLAAAPGYAATENAQERREARDTRQGARQDGRKEKVDCRKADQKNNAECRQEFRDDKREGRSKARDIKY